MGCGQTLIKTLLIIINVVFFLCGGAILGVGLYVRFNKQLGVDKMGDALGLKEIVQQLYTASYILIGFGAFTFVVGFLGCCGAIKSSKCMIWTYVVIVLAILGAEIGGGVFVYKNKETYIKKFEEEAQKYLTKNYSYNDTISDTVWNEAMKGLKCCGVKGVPDFYVSSYKTKTGNPAPTACCVMDGDQVKNQTRCFSDATKNVTSSEYLHTDGCLDTLQDYIVKYSKILLGAAIGIAAFELIVVFMGIGFACNIDKD